MVLQTVFLAEMCSCSLFMFTATVGTAVAEGNPLFIAVLNGCLEVFCLHAFGHISGSHINPGVTALGFAQNTISCDLMMVQLVGQLIGHIAGYGFVGLMYPELIDVARDSMKSQPGLMIMQHAFFAEMICATFFFLTWCAVWDRRGKNAESSIVLRLGGTMIGLTLLAAKYTGASFNLFRSFAICFFHYDFEYFWSFACAHLAGAVCAFIIWRTFLTPVCRHLARCRPRNGMAMDNVNRWIQLVSRSNWET